MWIVNNLVIYSCIYATYTLGVLQHRLQNTVIITIININAQKLSWQNIQFSRVSQISQNFSKNFTIISQWALALYFVVLIVAPRRPLVYICAKLVHQIIVWDQFAPKLCPKICSCCCSAQRSFGSTSSNSRWANLKHKKSHYPFLQIVRCVLCHFG